MARGVGGRDIFLDDFDRQRFCVLLHEVKKEIPFFNYAWVLMSNHFHLLVQVLQDPTGRFMHDLMFQYARMYQERYAWTGHVFQARYKAILCDKDNYLLELLRYIALNPVRAGMVKDPIDWAWSSHREYLGAPESGLLDPALPLAMFSRDERRARENYRRFVLDGLDMGHRPDFYPKAGRSLWGKCAPWNGKPASVFAGV